MTILDNGYHDLPPGKLAAVVTYLEMRQQVRKRPVSVEGLSIRRLHQPPIDWYRKLFRDVGEEWLWFSRLCLSDTELDTVLNHPKVEIFTLEHDGSAKGLLELDRRSPPDVELVFFGLTADMIGKGAGRYLMNFAIEWAFTGNARRLFLHTCTLDHSKAVAFYQRSGFRPYKRAIEIFDDPRLTGVLPKSASSHCPIIEP